MIQELSREDLLKQLEELKAAAAGQAVKEEAKGFTSPLNLNDAFIKRFPQGLKGRKSFLLTVENFSVTQSNIDGLLNWLRENNREEDAIELDKNRERIFDIHVLSKENGYEIFNSSILVYDSKNTLKPLILTAGEKFKYTISTISWDADSKILTFA